MTVCIAAIADEGKSLVLAADQMATMPHLIAENEGTHKIFELSKNIYLLASGSGFNANKIFNSTVNSSESNLDTVEDSLLSVQDAYKRIRLFSAEAQFLAPRGFKNVEDYLQQHNKLDQNIIALIDQQLTNPEFFQEYYIVAGVNPDGNARVFIIQPPGEFGQINDFVAIGSGQSHASNSLYARAYGVSKPEKEATYLVFEAKKRSEIAPGVGKATDMIVISKGEAKLFSDERLNELGNLYKKIVDDEKALLAKNLSASSALKEGKNDTKPAPKK